MDQIAVTGLTAFGFHGVLPEERKLGQRFVVDLFLELPLETRSDSLADTVNYAEVAAAVRAEIEGEPCHLIETLAGRIADVVLAQPLVQRVRVTVHKPQAPVPHDFTDVSVTITRSKQ